MVLGVILAVGLALLPFCAWAPDSTMEPAVRRGDLLVLLPLTPRAGDLVALLDPLDPNSWTLRRVEALGGNVAYDEMSFVVDEHRPELLDMGRDPAFVTLLEGAHLIQHLPRAVHWTGEVVTVPQGNAYLGADNRDVALDSRWWGTVPLPMIQGVVVFRFGVPGNPWRSWAEGRQAAPGV